MNLSLLNTLWIPQCNHMHKNILYINRKRSLAVQPIIAQSPNTYTQLTPTKEISKIKNLINLIENKMSNLEILNDSFSSEIETQIRPNINTRTSKRLLNYLLNWVSQPVLNHKQLQYESQKVPFVIDRILIYRKKNYGLPL